MSEDAKAGDRPFRFEPDKYYKHNSSGRMIHTLGFMDTTVCGRSLIAEENCSTNLITVGTDGDDYTAHYHEITKDEWLASCKFHYGWHSTAPAAEPDPNAVYAKLCDRSCIEVSPRIESAESGTDSDIVKALRTIDKAFAADFDFAWSWYCNIWSPIYDHTSATLLEANKAAPILMRHLFGYDVTGLERYCDVIDNCKEAELEDGKDTKFEVHPSQINPVETPQPERYLEFRVPITSLSNADAAVVAGNAIIDSLMLQTSDGIRGVTFQIIEIDPKGFNTGYKPIVFNKDEQPKPPKAE